MSVIKQRSPEAEAIRWEAVRMVDELESRRGPMRLDEQNEALCAHIGYLCQRRMLEELEPINASLSNIAAMTIGPLTVPPEIEVWQQSIMDRWHGIAAELLGHLPAKP